MNIFDSAELIEVHSHSLICPKVSAKQMPYCETILGETDLSDFI